MVEVQFSGQLDVDTMQLSKQLDWRVSSLHVGLVKSVTCEEEEEWIKSTKFTNKHGFRCLIFS